MTREVLAPRGGSWSFTACSIKKKSGPPNKFGESDANCSFQLTASRVFCRRRDRMDCDPQTGDLQELRFCRVIRRRGGSSARRSGGTRMGKLYRHPAMKQL